MAETFNLYCNGEKIASDLTESEYQAQDLEPNTDYEYAVSAQNDKGESDLSESITIHTDFSPVSDVSLDTNKIGLHVGEGRPLTATVSPSTANQNVDWSSSDTSIAKVRDDGLVTGVGAGTATITAKSQADDSLTDTCTVTVSTSNSDVKSESK